MPYDSSGTYTPPTGATTAAPGQVIRSALWNTIFTDLSAALTQIGPSQYSVKTGNYTITATDRAIVFNASGTATVTLPTASTYPGRLLYIKTVANQSVLASATVVQPLVGPAGTLGVTICAATAGKFAQLISDGTATWAIFAGN